MLFQKIFLFLILALNCFGDLREEFRRVGYIEVGGQERVGDFETLYERFDTMIAFLQNNPVWAHKLTHAKERFIRSRNKHLYSTDFFGLYDEGKGRGQIAFYYSTHFHEWIRNSSELKKVPAVMRFLEACSETQALFTDVVTKTAEELNLETVYPLFKVVKYLPSYKPSRPHYDGSAFSLFLNSTDNGALFLSSYKETLTVSDFVSPHRLLPLLLIPGTQLSELSIPPTPHIVQESGKTRYATIVFAMKPNYHSQQSEFSSLPSFRD